MFDLPPAHRRNAHSSTGVLVLTALLATTAAAVRGSVIYVGSGGAALGCQADSIAGALLVALSTPGSDEIRLTRSLTYTNQHVHLTNVDDLGTGALTFRGGFADCASPSPTDPLQRTVVSGQAGNPVFEIDTTGGRRSDVTLVDLVVSDSGERGITYSGPGSLTLRNTYVQDNAAGGVLVFLGNFAMDRPSWIRRNGSGIGGSTYGGGVDCSSCTVNISGPISGNSAMFGGGLSIDGLSEAHLGDGAWIQGNDAASGGGLYVEGGGQVDGTGGSVWGLLINDNTALQGGGIYATGLYTEVLLGSIRVTLNGAGYGGGIFVSDSAKVILEGYPRGSVLIDNYLNAGSYGAAVYAVGGSSVTVRTTSIEGNHGVGNTGSLFFAHGGSTELSLFNDAVYGNRANAIALVEANASFVAGFVSVAGNSGSSGPSLMVQANSGAVAELSSSILYDTGGSVAIGGAGVSADCVIADTLAGTTPSRSMLVVDPGFRDKAHGDLHLRPDSPAIDYCDAVNVNTDGDIDFDDRPQQIASVPDLYGSWDLGMDEAVFLFADGFESGDTSAWSSVVP